jgi:hypothetical protein
MYNGLLSTSPPPPAAAICSTGKLVFAAADTLAAPQLPFLVAIARRHHDRSFFLSAQKPNCYLV